MSFVFFNNSLSSNFVLYSEEYFSVRKSQNSIQNTVLMPTTFDINLKFNSQNFLCCCSLKNLLNEQYFPYLLKLFVDYFWNKSCYGHSIDHASLNGLTYGTKFNSIHLCLLQFITSNGVSPVNIHALISKAKEKIINKQSMGKVNSR